MNDVYRPVGRDDGSQGLVPAGSGLDLLAEDYADKRMLKELAAEAEATAALDADAAEKRLFDAMEAQSLRRITTPRGTFILNDLAWAKVDDEKAAREWAEDNMPELISLNRQRLAVVVRTAIKSNDDMPPGVSFTTSRKINWRRE